MKADELAAVVLGIAAAFLALLLLSPAVRRSVFGEALEAPSDQVLEARAYELARRAIEKARAPA